MDTHSERYRSGHNEAVLKTVCPKGRVGSNPTLSARHSCRRSLYRLSESTIWRSTQEVEGTPLERVQVVNSGARVQIPPSALKADIIRRIRMVSVFFCFHKKLCPMKQKRSARIAMGWKRILSQKRPAGGGEAREFLSYFR